MARYTMVWGMGLGLAVAACSGSDAQRRPDEQLIAYGGPAAVGQVPPSAAPRDGAGQLPVEVLRDPQERMTVMLQMRRQIVYKSRGIPEARYQAAVRPSLARQLTSAGFRPVDVQSILDDVDYSRRQRQ